MTTDRAPIHGFVKQSSAGAWHNFAAIHGCGGVSALLEAFGDLLDDMPSDPSDLPDWLQETVKDARRISAASRRRKRNGAKA